MTFNDILIWPVTAVAAAIACGLWRPVAARFGFIDRPGNRSLHDKPMARAAGFPSGVALAAVLLLWGEDFPFLLNAALLTAAVLMAFSTLDDRVPLPVVPRLGLHLLACFGFVGLLMLTATNVSPALQIAGVVVLGLALAWMTNLYNFMDGSDGLAGGQAVIGFLALAAIADLHGVAYLALAALAISGAAAGFLVWNAPPAQIFMGDAGSIPLGFLAGALALLLVWVSEASPWLVMLPFAPFWLDASITLVRRIFRGERFWEPHREHCYQALVQSGLGHGRTALVAYTLMLICALVAVVGSRWATPAWAPVLVAGCLAMLTGVGVWSIRRLRRAGGEGRTG